MNCHFQVGQKVVCIDDSEPDFISTVAQVVGGMDGLRKGATYTIRSVFVDPFYNAVCVRIVEIQRLPLSVVRGVRYEGGYDPARFRPVIERKTDISIFTALLTSQPEQVPA